MTKRTVLHVDYDPLQLEPSTPVPPHGMTFDEWVQAIMRDGDMTLEQATQQAREAMRDEVWLCERYQVAVRRNVPHDFGEVVGEVAWLSIKRIDRLPIHDWRDLQQLKNRLFGAECEAIELYPAESRMVDEANQYHLWVFCDPTVRVPIGFVERAVGDKSIGGSVQRPFAPEHNYVASDVVDRTRYAVQRRDTEQHWCAGSWGDTPQWLDYDAAMHVFRAHREVPLALSVRRCDDAES